ncbi:MAG: carbohydrate kinase [Siphonobacter sp.]
MKPKMVCFGEVLWDILPTGRQAGGAPFNVAVHAHQLGFDAKLISRVGEDELGNELLDFMREKGIATESIQRGKTHLTGVVKANVSNRNEVTYQIVQPVAWDYIMYEEQLTTWVKESDLFLFGSLGVRGSRSRETLYRLLEDASCNVFDINLRPPHYTRAIVEYLLNKATIVKMNHHELAEVTSWYEYPGGEEIAMRRVAERYNLKTVCVTRGENGACLLHENTFFESPGIKVEVQDTIGSGDSFLAALLYKFHLKEKPQQALDFACATGSYVATKHGATPTLTENDIMNFMASKPILHG